MQEQKRKFFLKARSNDCLSLPPISDFSINLKGLISSENTLKLCKVGKDKSKFINFDLKNPDDMLAQASYRKGPPRIPLMVINSNKFSHLKNKKERRKHPLLVSRSRNIASLPSLERHNIPSIKTQHPSFLENKVNLFIT